MPLSRRHISRGHPRPQHGFTLVEVMAGLAALSLLLIGVTSLFILMLRMAASVTNSTSVSLDASNAAQRIIENLREAQDFVPVDANRNPVADGTAGSGLYLCFPNTYKNVTVGRGGSATDTVATLDDTTGYTNALYIYRSDATGTASGTGTCLWIRGTENGTAVASSTVGGAAVPGHALVTTLNPASPTAVQFRKPMDTNVPPSVLPFRVQLRITCSTADTIHAQTSSDSTAGGTVNMTGECVQIRNHGSVPKQFTGPLPLP